MFEYIKRAEIKNENNISNIREIVNKIIAEVRKNGDEALKEMASRFDGVKLESIKVTKDEVEAAYKKVDVKTVESLKFAAEQIGFFAKQQLACLRPLECENVKGVKLGHRLVPISSCGAYVPGGRYSLPSSALMSIIPAKVAGVTRVAACAPPSKEFGNIHPVTLVAMDIAGADEIYCVGGAQAVGALVYGTETIKPVDMIVGPGNAYVTEAKRQVNGIVGIDALAGPSEVLIIADDTASAKFISLDMLAQCEHDPSARGILVTNSKRLAREVQSIISEELEMLQTADIAKTAWEENSMIVWVETFDEAVAYSDEIAPEHLELHTKCNKDLAVKLKNYGSLFIGENSPVAFGDYVSGTNHILPTMGCSKYTNGVWVGMFIKVLSYQEVSAEGAERLKGVCGHLAGIEGLMAHKKAAEIR